MKSVSRIDGQTHRFLGKDSNLPFVHGKSLAKVFPASTGKPRYFLEKTQIYYPFTKIYLSSRNFIRNYGRIWSESPAGIKSREKCRDGFRKFVNLIIRKYVDAAPLSWLLHDFVYLLIRPFWHTTTAVMPRVVTKTPSLRLLASDACFLHTFQRPEFCLHGYVFFGPGARCRDFLCGYPPPAPWCARPP